MATRFWEKGQRVLHPLDSLPVKLEWQTEQVVPFHMPVVNSSSAKHSQRPLVRLQRPLPEQIFPFPLPTGQYDEEQSAPKNPSRHTHVPV